MTAADLSQPVTSITTKSGKNGVKAFKSIGVKTVARYYDWPEGGVMSCKVLLPAESDAILAGGLNIVSVYQDAHDNPETFFDRKRGRVDVGRAIKLAKANGQPAGSAIYFAVDGVDQTIKDSVFEYAVNKGLSVSKARRNRLIKADVTFRKHIKFYERFRVYHKKAFNKSAANVRPSDMLPLVENYFREVKSAMASSNAGYKIGAYGSGATCTHLQKKGLIDYCWLAMSTGWPGYKEQLQSGKWHLAQQRTTVCKNWKFGHGEKVRFDFNRINKSKADFGQWSKKSTPVGAASLPIKCAMTW